MSTIILWLGTLAVFTFPVSMALTGKANFYARKLAYMLVIAYIILSEYGILFGMKAPVPKDPIMNLHDSGGLIELMGER